MEKLVTSTMFYLRTTVLLGALSFYPLWVNGSSTTFPLDKMSPSFKDKPSLQRGAKYFMNYCFGCHELSFQRYQRVAKDLGIPEDLMIENLIFNEAKIHDLMQNGIDKKQARSWFGTAPPDLTLVARVRGTDWLYTYLRTFYYDPKQTWGANNQVFPNVGMPHILEPLQGRQLLHCEDTHHCHLVPDPQHPGSMTTSEFDSAMYDLVNFLAYSSEPMKMDRQRIGVYVLLFLAIMLVFSYMLKREYWKDVSV